MRATFQADFEANEEDAYVQAAQAYRDQLDDDLSKLANDRLGELASAFKHLSPGHKLDIIFGMGREAATIDGLMLDTLTGAVVNMVRQALADVHRITSDYMDACPDDVHVTATGEPVTVLVDCEGCGQSEEITIIRSAFVGSAFDYCTFCDRERDPAEQAKVLQVFGA